MSDRFQGSVLKKGARNGIFLCLMKSMWPGETSSVSSFPHYCHCLLELVILLGELFPFTSVQNQVICDSLLCKAEESCEYSE